MSFEFPFLFTIRQHKIEEMLAAIQNKHQEKQSKQPALFQLVELVDMVALQRLVDNCVSYLGKGKDTHFLDYAKAMKASDGNLTVRYLSSSRTTHGRAYPERSLSLGSLSRQIRSTLARNIYHDIDMSNAHPRILLQIAEREQLPCKMIKQYIENREELLDTLPYDRKISKEIFLAMIFGNYQAVLRTHGVVNLGIPPEAEYFKDEIGRIANWMYKNYPQYHELCKTSTKRSATVMSFVFQEYEVKIRDAAFEFARANGWEVGVSIHDGFLLYRREDAQITDEFLQQLQDHVFNVCNLKIPFVEKPFEEPLF